MISAKIKIIFGLQGLAHVIITIKVSEINPIYYFFPFPKEVTPQ